MKRALVLLASSLLLLACGGSSPPPEAPVQEPEPTTSRPRRPSLSVSQELGSLDEEAVNAAFSRLAPRLMGCMERGSRDNELLSGHVRFFVRIDQEGRARFAYLADSSLGDRETERCMLGILKSTSWPLPIDGEGEARSSFDFDASPDVRPPVAWGSERVTPVLPKLRAKVSACAPAPGRYRVTAYVSEEGSVLSAGIAPPDEKGEEAADCIAKAVKKLDLGSPGSWPAKVSFDLQP